MKMKIKEESREENLYVKKVDCFIYFSLCIV